MMIKPAFAAVLGAATLAAPASAEPQWVTVPYADLDLTTPVGMTELQERVDRAAWRVCKFTPDGTMRTRIDQVRCYRAARRMSAPHVTAASRQQRPRPRAA